MTEPILISQQEAIDLLHKWQTENRVVQCWMIVESTKIKAALIGRIDSIENGIVHLSDKKSTNPMGDKIWIDFPLDDARCEYQAAEDTPEALRGKLKGYDATLYIFHSGLTIGLLIMIPLDEWAKL